MRTRRLAAEQYVSGVLAGDVASLARTITVIESDLPSDNELAAQILEVLLPHAGKSRRLGITGVPGVGKSTFLDTMGLYLIHERGEKLAVLSVDPSSPVTGGSILGDKTRMEKLSVEPNAFIRPSPSRGTMGGVAGHAGLFSTAEDLAVYAQMLHGGGAYGGVRILGERTVQLMTAPQNLPGGGVRTLGWDMQSSLSSNRGETFSNKAFGHGALRVEALGDDNRTVIDRGTLTVIDNQVDQTTGTVKLKAEFPNADLQIWPGQFVNVKLLIDTLRQVIVVPTAAVQRGPNGTFAYIIEGGDTATVRPVTVAQQDDVQAVIADGMSQIVGQDLSQPGRQLRLRAAAELGQRLVRLQEGLLHHVGGVQAGAQSGIELQAGQQTQVVAVTLQVLG